MVPNRVNITFEVLISKMFVGGFPTKEHGDANIETFPFTRKTALLVSA